MQRRQRLVFAGWGAAAACHKTLPGV